MLESTAVEVQIQDADIIGAIDPDATLGLMLRYEGIPYWDGKVTHGELSVSHDPYFCVSIYRWSDSNE